MSLISGLQLPQPSPAPVCEHNSLKSLQPPLITSAKFPSPTWLQEQISFPKMGFDSFLPLNNSVLFYHPLILLQLKDHF